MKKKILILSLPVIFAISLLPVIFAINLDIKKEVKTDVIISELKEPAIFKFIIKNLGNTEDFEVYSLVGVDFSPRGTFPIAAGETKEIEVRAYPEERLKQKAGLLNFVYKIRGVDSGIKEDTLTVNIVDFKDAISVTADAIAPGYEEAKVYVDNKYNFNFSEIKAKFSSVFFSKDEAFSLAPLEKKEFKIAIDKEKMIGLSAGQYILTAELETGSAKEEITTTIKFVEKADIGVTEKSSGVIFRKKIIEKINEGNVLALVEISMGKDIVSRLFTKLNQEPDKVERKGVVVYYSWNRELNPGESMKVEVDTNYLYPLILVIVIAIVAYLIFASVSSTLILKKRVSFVKAKGGEFALKVSLYASSKKFVEKISIIDKFPAIARLYERFGIYEPDKIDEKNRRLEWQIESLQPGEERVFSYIIYSKIGVIGKFELPPAIAVYERDGKIFETRSNKAFFMNEPRKKQED